ncbi:hypothetical protein RhiirB3_455711 [Rhizophagus irregularis]|nr:hypothetical protein RhiirB3_455711 [Rhizophagus irregularis]
MNNNNKRVKEFQQARDVYTEKHVSPNIQTRTLSPMEEDSEVNKTVKTEKFIYEPSTALGILPSSPNNQEGNTQRLDNFEARMDQAFSILTNMSGKFDHLMNNQIPYVNEDRAREFNNGTTNPQYNQQ